MRFNSILTLGFIAVATAFPQPQLGAVGGLLGSLTGGAGGTAGTAAVPLPTVPYGTTIGSAINSCGDNTQLSCCNKADTSGDSVNEASGVLTDLLPGLLSGNGGLGLFDGCSKLSVTGCEFCSL